MNKLNATKKYRVVTHEANYTPPDFGALLSVGDFDTAEEAIECLKQVIDKQLLSFVNEGKTPKEAYDQFSLYGEIPIIQGEPRVYVQPYEYAKRRVTIIESNIMIAKWFFKYPNSKSQKD
jgi:hypothetical protein